MKAEASREVLTAVDRDPATPLDVHTEGLTEDQQTKLRTLLTNYKDVFSYTPDQLGRCSIVKHTIDTGSNRMTPANKEEIDKQIIEMLGNDVITTSISPWPP